MSQFHFSPRANRAGEIHWHAWNAETFEEARQQDKPILLDISAVWCHWCHVMDETTYSDPEVIQLVNDSFVPVRVDTDERPDVNRRYNLGGWPTTAFLSPDGELLTGGTYLPAGQMRSTLIRLSELYRNSKDEIGRKIAEANARRDATGAARAAVPAPLSPQIVETILSEVRSSFDPANGGFGDQPKFPSTDALELALEKYYETGDPALANIVSLTCARMGSGGLFDAVWGGFFRYATTRDWSVPHYEKMLEDNAKLLTLYVHAYQVSGEEPLRATARALIGYVDGWLSNREEGGFYGSQDADETYYALPRAERDKLPAPFVDRTLYADWNALMVSAFLQAATVFPDQAARLQDMAYRTLDRLWTDLYRPDYGLYHSVRPGAEPQLVNSLADLARVTLALLDAYQANGDPAHLSRARVLADLAIRTLQDPETGAFWSEPRTGRALGLLRIPDRSPADNAVLAQALGRLHRLEGVESYRTAAERALAYFAPDAPRLGFTGADYALAVNHWLFEPVSVHVVGDAADARTHTLQWAALAEYSPDKIVQVLDPRRDAARLAQLGYPLAGPPRAYVCVGTRCLAPAETAEAVVAGMREMAR